MSLNGAVVYLQTQAANISGVRVAPSYPTDSAGAFPAVISYVSSLEKSVGYAGITDIYTITTEIHYPNTDLYRTIAKLQPMWELFTSKVWADSTLSANVDTTIDVKGVIDPGAVWASTPTIALRFNTQVKCRRTS